MRTRAKGQDIDLVMVDYAQVTPDWLAANGPFFGAIVLHLLFFCTHIWGQLSRLKGRASAPFQDSPLPQAVRILEEDKSVGFETYGSFSDSPLAFRPESLTSVYS